jgi:hypothetical protein
MGRLFADFFLRGPLALVDLAPHFVFVHSLTSFVGHCFVVSLQAICQGSPVGGKIFSYHGASILFPRLFFFSILSSAYRA